jgi:hypothetical protein
VAASGETFLKRYGEESADWESFRLSGRSEQWQERRLVKLRRSRSSCGESRVSGASRTCNLQRTTSVMALGSAKCRVCMLQESAIRRTVLQYVQPPATCGRELQLPAYVVDEPTTRGRKAGPYSSYRPVRADARWLVFSKPGTTSQQSLAATYCYFRRRLALRLLTIEKRK